MLLYYHKDPKGNFGDDLNPWLWERLLPGFLRGYLPHEPKMRSGSIADETLFVGIGTLLNDSIPAGPKKVVFGTGAGYGPVPVLDSTWDISCVRGPVTAAMLGLEKSAAVTDPAVLVRTIDLGNGIRKTHRFAYMPHCSSARNADWSAICGRAGIGFVDPHHCVDDVLQGIRSTEILITEALHGAIVADALRIPWIPVATSSAILQTKWLDWSQSLGIDYKPTRMPTLWSMGAQPSRLVKMWYSVKHGAIALTLRNIIRHGIPLLSASERIEHVTSELQERLEKVRQRYRA